MQNSVNTQKTGQKLPLAYLWPYMLLKDRQRKLKAITSTYCLIFILLQTISYQTFNEYITGSLLLLEKFLLLEHF